MIRNLAALSLMLGLTSPMSAQARTDSVRSNDSAPPNAWVSAGIGLTSSWGLFAGRAAGSLAFSRVMFTVSTTAIANIDKGLGSTNILVGVRSPGRGGFGFVSGGLAVTNCEPRCVSHNGFAFEGGFHFGGRLAGVGVVAFAAAAPHTTATSGVVASLDLGWFGR